MQEAKPISEHVFICTTKFAFQNLLIYVKALCQGMAWSMAYLTGNLEIVLNFAHKLQ